MLSVTCEFLLMYTLQFLNSPQDRHENYFWTHGFLGRDKIREFNFLI